ncbi:MAG: 3'-5' exonuclease, partial [Geminicoccaceae bacterium]|nr:3'-5' exonuclease [Geminicoccaceae bacterium]
DRVRLDLSYTGPPVPAVTLGRWLEGAVREDAGIERLSDVLERHDGEIWSERSGDAGRSVIRLLLPAAARDTTPPLDLPPRPEFYDFTLLSRPAPSGHLQTRPLGDLTFVVFDTETTGLDPGRDRIIQLAAVRIVNRRLLTGETFDRLVDPGRPIPKSSIRFHGITDDMVQGRPPIEVVLPQFQAFAEGAVLVAHNAAFDLAFLREAGPAAGITFGQPVLDTLLLSAALHGHTDQHGLDAIAARFGVSFEDRHRALGDALGTAQIFLRMIDLLEGQGVRTLGEALDLSERAVEVRRRQNEAFAWPGRTRSVRVASEGPDHA